MTRFKSVAADWIVAAIACLALSAIAANDSLPKQTASTKTAPPHSLHFNQKGNLQA